MFIRSERLFLRPAWPEDWAELYAAVNDEGVVRNLAKAPWPYAMEDAMAFVRLPQEPLLPHFLITLPSDEGSRLIGSAGLGRHGDQAELGYWIARSHWGQGYATEAVRAVLQIAKTLGHRRISAAHFADNPASGRVLTKAGFTRLGEPTLRFSRARRSETPGEQYGIDLDDQLVSKGAISPRIAPGDQHKLAVLDHHRADVFGLVVKQAELGRNPQYLAMGNCLAGPSGDPF